MTTDEIFDTQKTFADLGLAPPILKALEKVGFKHPTRIQAEMIPPSIEGKDILGQSKTGTGKTAAFGLPMLHRIQEGEAFSGLALVPTRELAIQVAHDLRELGRFTKLHVVPIYGGQRMKVQGPKLERGPEIIVGTPGRIMDFHQRGQLPYDKVRMAVLDEVDRMLDIGFREDIRKILGTMRQEHQTMFVSATISPEIEKLAGRYLNDPVPVNVSSAGSLTVERVKQKWASVQAWDKSRLLVHMLRKREPGLTLIFCRTKQTVDALAGLLARKKIDAHAIHGDMYQGRRNRVIQQLRAGELKVLVASDLAARGLDVDDITHVINYDVPEDPEIYVHRIGRTARAGREGEAWSFVTPDQGALLTNIEMLTNVEIGPLDLEGFEPGPEPDEVIAKRQRREKREQAQREDGKRVTKALPTRDDAQDAAKFPGGLVPVAKPSKKMGGRLRTRRR